MAIHFPIGLRTGGLRELGDFAPRRQGRCQPIGGRQISLRSLPPMNECRDGEADPLESDAKGSGMQPSWRFCSLTF